MPPRIKVTKEEISKKAFEITEKDKKFWIEHDGIIKLEIDTSQLAITMKENFVYTSILEAKILSVDTNHDFIEYVFDIHQE